MSRQRYRAATVILAGEEFKKTLPAQDMELADRVAAYLAAGDVDGAAAQLAPFADAPVNEYERCFTALSRFVKSLPPARTPHFDIIPSLLTPLLTRAYHTMRLYPPVLQSETVLKQLALIEHELEVPNVDTARDAVSNIRALVADYAEAVARYDAEE